MKVTRFLILSSASLLAVCVGILPALAAQGSRANGAGHVKFPNGQREFTFAARQTGSGTEAKGTAMTNSLARRFSFGRGQLIHVDVTCLRTVGNVAYMSGVVDKASDGFFGVGDEAWFMVTDNGEGRKSEPDTISAIYLSGWEENDDGDLEFWSVNDCTEDFPRPVGSPGYLWQPTADAWYVTGNVQVR